MYQFIIGWPLPRSTSCTPFLRWSTTTRTEHTSWLTTTQRCPCPTPMLATLPLCCLQIRRDRSVRGILTLLGLSWLCRTYVEWILSSETCRLMNQWKYYVATCQLAHGLHLFASYSFQYVAAALVVVYNTDSSIYTHVILDCKKLVPIRRYDQSCVTEQSGMAYSSGLRN